MTLSDDLRKMARRTYGVNASERLLVAADRIDWLEARYAVEVDNHRASLTSHEWAMQRIEGFESALRWYNDNDTVPGQTDGMGCGCCSHRVDVPETVQVAWDSVTP